MPTVQTNFKSMYLVSTKPKTAEVSTTNLKAIEYNPQMQENEPIAGPSTYSCPFCEKNMKKMKIYNIILMKIILINLLYMNAQNVIIKQKV